MSKRRNQFFCAVFCCLFLSSCCTVTPDKSISFVVEESPSFVTDYTSSRISRGEDVTLNLVFLDGFSFGGCSYEEGQYSYVTDGNMVTLTCFNVRYATRLKIISDSIAGTVYYDFNGGLENGNDHEMVTYTNLTHLRANTRTEKSLFREGYSLIGWNTRSDGSGSHIGLGSRVTLEEKAIILYAEWKKEVNLSELTYEENEDGITLLSYTGGKEMEEFVLPETVNGKTVTSVAASFAQGIRAETLVLPLNCREIATGAFTDCEFSEIYLGDNYDFIQDDSFSCSFKKYHINAATAPRYADHDFSGFTDRMDQLILHEEEKKMILFAGCSFSYGIDSVSLDEAYSHQYRIMNFGIIGGTNATFQMRLISKYLHEGDVMIHAPEVASGYQLYYNISAEHRMFVMCESNYDLLSEIDCSSTPNMMNAFGTYSSTRKEDPEEDYNYCSSIYNDYGDVTTPRGMGADTSYSENYTYYPIYVTDLSLDRLSEDYKSLESKGVKVLVSYSPVNYNGLSAEDIKEKVWLTFEDKFTGGLEKRGISVISSAADYLYTGRYFYDTDYHLNDYGVKKRTEQLLKDLTDITF